MLPTSFFSLRGEFMKKVFSILIFLLLFIPIQTVSANTVNLDYFGTTSESSFMWANTTTGEHEFSQITYTSIANNAQINFYGTISGSASFMSSKSVNQGTATITPPTGTNAIKLISNDGGEIYLNYLKSTNPNAINVYFETGGSLPDDDVSDGSDSCDCVINVPGWGDMLGQLDDIKNAIPPAPNWQQVANTMRDTIVPSFISEMDSLLGSAPTPPSAPVFNNPVQADFDRPSGSLPINLDDSAFSANDIKQGATEIEFKEDQSGGFELLDPVGSLPSQEEFKENIPTEQELQAPTVPDVSGTAPEPPEQENIAPNPPQVTGTAPSPIESDNIAPSPTEGENVAPTPGDTNGTAPLPGDDSGTAPVPSDDLTTAPIPSE